MDTSRDRPPALPIADAGSNRPPAPAVRRLHAPPMRGIRGLLFDIGGVLYDDTLWRRRLLQLLSHLGLQTNYRCFFRIWDREYLAEVHRGRREFSEALAAFLLSAGLSRGQIDEVEAACRARRRQLEAGARALPGVRTTLQRLHQSGLVLGVLSNSEHPARALQQRLEQFAVGGLFTAVVSSIDLGRTMPDPTSYLSALRAMKLPAEHVAFVGHDTAELAGAAAVEMPTIAFNFDTDAQADVYLGRFEELLEVLGTRPPLAAAG